MNDFWVPLTRKCAQNSINRSNRLKTNEKCPWTSNETNIRYAICTVTAQARTKIGDLGKA